MVPATYDWPSGLAYLSENYSLLGQEQKSLLAFFHEAYDLIPHQKRLLEIGGGPTIYQLISASRKVDKIVFSEYSPKFREQIKSWLKFDDKFFKWDSNFSYVLFLEHKENTAANLKEIKDRLRSKMTDVVKCDIFKRPMCPTIGQQKFDILSVNYCPESITEREEKFIYAMKNICSAIRYGGYLVMTLLRKSHFYVVGGKKIATFPVDENYIKVFLGKLGLTILLMKIVTVSVNKVSKKKYGDYRGDICILARKNSTILD